MWWKSLSQRSTVIFTHATSLSSLFSTVTLTLCDCGVQLAGALVEYSFDDRRVVRSDLLTGTQLHFIFNSGSV